VLEKSRIPPVLLKEYSEKRAGCSGVASMALLKGQIFSGKRIGVLLIRNPMLSTLSRLSTTILRLKRG
jgi:hypothetical protein